jgi:rare lipoprotein A
MDEGTYRRQAVSKNHRGDRPSRVHGRPDRAALWAVFVALAALVAAALSATGANAATGSGGTSTEPECVETEFGDRLLRLGDCGEDVQTLNWLLNSKRYASDVGFHEQFDDATDGAVRTLQDRAGIGADGVVDADTRDELRGGMRTRTASWYGPGFWRNETACGKKLRRKTVGVAHKRLPCGTKVVFNKGGRWLRTKVIDRGPYAKGVSWDLTQKAAEALGVDVTEKVRSAVVKRRSASS